MDRRQPSSKNVGEVLAYELTKLLGSFWEKEKIPKDWCESMTGLIYKKVDRYSWIIIDHIIQSAGGHHPSSISS